MKFSEPAYLKAPDEPDDVIVFGKAPGKAEEDLAAGIARFGGYWRSPSYVRAYVTSARILIDGARQRRRLDDVGLPAFYLQRHATELFLKQLLSFIHEIFKLKLELREADCGQITPRQEERLNNSHNLISLWSDLKDLSPKLGFPMPPDEIGELVRILSEFEVSETWARYERGTSRSGGRSHVDKEVALPIFDLQDRLEKAVSATLFSVDEPVSYGREIYEEWLSYMNAAERAE